MPLAVQGEGGPAQLVERAVADAEDAAQADRGDAAGQEMDLLAVVADARGEQLEAEADRRLRLVEAAFLQFGVARLKALGGHKFVDEEGELAGALALLRGREGREGAAQEARAGGLGGKHGSCG